MLRYIVFKHNYKDAKRKYLFFKGVKYKLKDETNSNYFTIRKVKLNKNKENKLYIVGETK